MKRHPPQHLHPAYNWTEAADELRELKSLKGQALLEYCEASHANATEHMEHGGHDVTVEGLLALHDWLNRK